jgi:hypothetical protein
LVNEIIVVYTKNHGNPTKQNADLLIVKAGVIGGYHWAFIG